MTTTNIPAPRLDAHEKVLLSLRLRNAAIICDREHRPHMASLLTEAADVVLAVARVELTE